MFRTLFAHLERDVFDHFGESRTSYDNKVHTIDLPGGSQSFGGQQFFAQAGGKDVSGILGARDKMIELLNL